MDKVLHKSQYFKLTQEVHRKSKTGKQHWVISLRMWDFRDVETVRDMLDPERNRSGKQGTHWKYRNLETAKRDLAMLILKFE